MGSIWFSKRSLKCCFLCSKWVFNVTWTQLGAWRVSTKDNSIGSKDSHCPTLPCTLLQTCMAIGIKAHSFQSVHVCKKWAIQCLFQEIDHLKFFFLSFECSCFYRQQGVVTSKLTLAVTLDPSPILVVTLHTFQKLLTTSDGCNSLPCVFILICFSLNIPTYITCCSLSHHWRTKGVTGVPYRSSFFTIPTFETPFPPTPPRKWWVSMFHAQIVP